MGKGCLLGCKNMKNDSLNARNMLIFSAWIERNMKKVIAYNQWVIIKIVVFFKKYLVEKKKVCIFAIENEEKRVLKHNKWSGSSVG